MKHKNTEFLTFDENAPSPSKIERIIRYVILDPTDRKSAVENRVLDEYQHKGTFVGLFNRMVEEQTISKSKEDGKFIIPTSFTDKKLTEDGSIHRTADNVDLWFMLPVDVDGGMTIEQAKKKWADYTYILYTSFNHRKDGLDKFRMLFLLSTPIPDAEFTKRKKAIYEWLGDGVDRTCLYRSRGFYMPTFNTDNKNERVLELNQGKVLDIFPFKAEEPVAQVIREQSETTDEQREELLDKLQQTEMGYETWWQMVEGLKSNGFSVGDLISISQGNPLHESPTLPHKTPEVCAKYWNSQRMGSPGLGKLIAIIRKSHPGYRLKRDNTAEIDKVIDEKRAQLEKIRAMLNGEGK